MGRTMRRALLATALLAACAIAADAAPKTVKPAPGNDVALALDEVHTVTFKAPISTVYVGNPAIADVTMIDARHAFVQGKSYGRTNIVALNHDNAQVFNAHVTVTGSDGGSTVVLNRGAQRITLNCAGGRCEPTPMPGDDQKTYDAAAAETTSHQNTARGVAAADSGGKTASN
jgi:hypothetical protein